MTASTRVDVEPGSEARLPTQRPGGGGVPAPRAVVRWAWRMFRREWRQQALVLALLSVAVGAAIFGASAAYNMAPSPDAEFGAADRRIRLDGSDPEALRADLSTVRQWFGTAEVIAHRYLPVPGSVETLEVRAQDPTGALGAPLLALRDGRYPTADGEVAVTDSVARTFQVHVGGSLVLDGVAHPVVGLVENPADLADDFVLAPPWPGRQPPGTLSSGTLSSGTLSSGTLSSGTPPPGDRPDDVTVLVRGESTGFSAAPRGALASMSESRRRQDTTEKADAAGATLALSTVVMLLVCLVAGAGFVVVAQRRMRQLGMLAAIGATQRHLRLVVLANGVVVGLVAAVTGTILGLAGWVAAGPRLEAAAGHRIDRFDVPLWLLGAGVLLAVGTSTVAAWWPARSAARVPVTVALSARPPRPRRARRSAAAAAVFFGAGFGCLAVGIDPVADRANPLLVVAGTAAMVLGILFVSPLAIRALAAIAGRLPVAARLALRDLARYQARSGSALAAISVGLAISTAIVVLATAGEATADEGNLSDRQVLIRVGDAEPMVPKRTAPEIERLEGEVERLVATFAGATVVPLDAAVSPDFEERRNNQVVRPAAVLGRPVGPDTLRDVGVLYVATPGVLRHVGVDPAAVAADTDILTPHTGDLFFANVPDQARRATPISGVAPIEVASYSSAPRSFITLDAIRRLGLEPVRSAWLIETPRPLTPAQVAAARDVAAASGMTVEARRGTDGLAALRLGATAVGMLLALGILAMTVGLIRSEAGRDLRILTAAGATSTTRRTLTATTAGALALMAVVLGTGGAYLALVAGYLDDLEPLARVPLLHLAVTAAGVPLAAAVAGWLLAGREPPFLARPALD